VEENKAVFSFENVQNETFDNNNRQKAALFIAKIRNDKTPQNYTQNNESESGKTNAETNIISSTNPEEKNVYEKVLFIEPGKRVTIKKRDNMKENDLVISLRKSRADEIFLNSNIYSEKRDSKRILKKKKFRCGPSQLKGKCIGVKELIANKKREVFLKSCWKTDQGRGSPQDFAYTLNETMKKAPENLAWFFIKLFREEIRNNKFNN